MARPIKETPVLTGKDAEQFRQNMEQLQYVTQAEVEKARRAYETAKSKSPNCSFFGWWNWTMCGRKFRPQMFRLKAEPCPQTDPDQQSAKSTQLRENNDILNF